MTVTKVMNESFLHYIWQMQYFRKEELCTKEGETVQVLHPGTLNTHAGPDFHASRIRIGGMEWSGSVEIHVRSSEWIDHHHDEDQAYENVILHVVWRMDRVILRRDQTVVPTVELWDRIDARLTKKYRQLVTSSFQIPCRGALRDVPEVYKISALDRALVERLERKSGEILGYYEATGRSWEETAYWVLSKNFGFKVNNEPFLQLAKSVPLRYLRRHSSSILQVESMLFGAAGFLEGPSNVDYFRSLQTEYKVLASKYRLPGLMKRSQWKFLRMRPANFPTLRIAQLAAVLRSQNQLFSGMFESTDLGLLKKFFSCEPSPYWRTHYYFGSHTSSEIHVLGLDSIHTLVINAVIPLWAAYSLLHHDDTLLERAIEVLKSIPREENSIIRSCQNAGINLSNSHDTQAAIELFNNFCAKKRCLNCSIGTFLIRPVRETANSYPG